MDRVLIYSESELVPTLDFVVLAELARNPAPARGVQAVSPAATLALRALVRRLMRQLAKVEGVHDVERI